MRDCPSNLWSSRMLSWGMKREVGKARAHKRLGMRTQYSKRVFLPRLLPSAIRLTTYRNAIESRVGGTLRSTVTR